jgi:hypothetical protein
LLADPGTLRITRLPRGPLDDTGPVMVWTGAAALAINPGAEISGPAGNVRPGDMAAWDPASGAWRRLPGAPGRCKTTPRPPGPAASCSPSHQTAPCSASLLKRRDRMLHEALTARVDPLHLALVFGLSHTTASRYTLTACDLLAELPAGAAGEQHYAPGEPGVIRR